MPIESVKLKTASLTEVIISPTNRKAFASNPLPLDSSSKFSIKYNTPCTINIIPVAAKADLIAVNPTFTLSKSKFLKPSPN